jgi:hypothetical protein
MLYRSDYHPVRLRKARTRTLIQAAGLLEKAGLFECVGLEMGDDLQKDPETFEGAATLMGAFLSLYDTFHSQESEAQKLLWAARGKYALAKGKETL